MQVDFGVDVPVFKFDFEAIAIPMNNSAHCQVSDTIANLLH